MKHFNGKLTKVETPDGKINKKQKPIVRVTQFAKFGEVKAPFYRVNALKGEWAEKQATATAEKIKRLANRYVFGSALVRLFFRHEASADTAPATTAEIDTAVIVGVDAPGKSPRAAEATVDQEEKLSVYARAVCYLRAAAVYVEKLFFTVTAKAEAAMGAVGKPVSDILSFRRLADAETAPVVEGEVQYSIPDAETDATATTAPTTEAEAEDSVATGHSATGATWIYPEVVDGVLIIRQAYQATKTNGVLELR